MEWDVLTQIIERNDGARLWRERSTVFPSVRFKLHPENMFQKLKLLKTKIRCDEVHLMLFLIPSKTQLRIKTNKNKTNKQTCKTYSKNFDETHSDQVWVFHFFSLEYGGAIRDPSYLWPKTATSIDLCKQQTLGVTWEAISSLSEIHWEVSREETQA